MATQLAMDLPRQVAELRATEGRAAIKVSGYSSFRPVSETIFPRWSLNGIRGKPRWKRRSRRAEAGLPSES